MILMHRALGCVGYNGLCLRFLINLYMFFNEVESSLRSSIHTQQHSVGDNVIQID